jgi:hypothetical protein
MLLPGGSQSKLCSQATEVNMHGLELQPLWGTHPSCDGVTRGGISLGLGFGDKLYFFLYDVVTHVLIG